MLLPHQCPRVSSFLWGMHSSQPPLLQQLQRADEARQQALPHLVAFEFDDSESAVQWHSREIEIPDHPDTWHKYECVQK